MMHLGPDLSQPSASLASALPSEEERAFLQQRLMFLFKTLCLLSGCFYAITSVTVPLLRGESFWHILTSPGYAFHLAGVVTAFAFWQACRGEARSMRLLRLFDCVGLLGALCLLKIDAYIDNDSHALMLVTNAVIISRAVLVPGSIRRAFWMSVAGALPDPIFLGLMRAKTPGDFLVPALEALLWSAIAIIMASLVTRVIYGLRKQVRDARKLGQYTLLRMLGAGAMGDVYLASHAMMRRRTAIKVLRANEDGHGLERFEREVQLTSQLTHPNTIAIYDYGRTAEGLFYYVMEHLEGMDLDRLLAAAGPLPPARVIHILRQVCGALEEAHGLGLLHRDIKPANLFLCRRRGVPDLVKVLDFGLVKQVGASEEGGATRAQVVGTPHYMAPEAIVDPLRVDGRADLYSLGAVGYALLTGTHVFKGQSAGEICLHHVNTPPEVPSARLGRELPEDLCGIILRCLEKRPESRFASTRELRTALELCADAGKWTEQEAERWWEQNGATLETTAVRHTPRDLTGTQTVVTDASRREAA